MRYYSRLVKEVPYNAVVRYYMMCDDGAGGVVVMVMCVCVCGC